MNRTIIISAIIVLLASCGGTGRQTADEEPGRVAAMPQFVADSAMRSIVEQCAFGARVPGSEAHRLCGDYIVSRFAQYGLDVAEQTATLTAWNGDRLPMRNIVASLHPDAEMRLLVTAHWDSRPWADNDPDEANHRTPVMAANDGASGVAVMIEMARILSAYDGDCGLARGEWGVDFVCFDCEDYGIAQWSDDEDDSSWALGSAYWAQQPHRIPYRAAWGINLDMVGGTGSVFRREGYSRHYAPSVVQRIWDTARQLGYSQYFVNADGGYITDDHVDVNRVLRIPTVDIIGQGTDSFPLTWHTVHDTPDNIDPAVLRAVGAVVTAMVCNPI